MKKLPFAPYRKSSKWLIAPLSKHAKERAQGYFMPGGRNQLVTRPTLRTVLT